ncbi:uroporphyrinogen-III synthase [Agrilactobacillus fermenti]|uniref:uroporphyrinogen-III synthase n=1 Tax=Agrilactobacillus fermenti TaxID=2586909 RepID=UPI001E4BBC64|nr:hypothetical protein [Agrilactobacillus fermenti]MCD2255712.1 hypothetical protein [Agrilactobacillus fermenti]
MAPRILVTRPQMSLPPKLLTELLLAQADFVNLHELKPVHLHQKAINQLYQADMLAVTNRYALEAVAPFFQKRSVKPKIATTSPIIETFARKQGFNTVILSRSEQQDSLATMLRARMFADEAVLWLRSDISRKYHPLNLNKPNWQALTTYFYHISYETSTNLRRLLRTKHYTHILISDLPAFEKIIALEPDITAIFVTLNHRSAQVIKSQGYRVIFPHRKNEPALEMAVKMIV